MALAVAASIFERVQRIFCAQIYVCILKNVCLDSARWRSSSAAYGAAVFVLDRRTGDRMQGHRPPGNGENRRSLVSLRHILHPTRGQRRVPHRAVHPEGHLAAYGQPRGAGGSVLRRLDFARGGQLFLKKVLKSLAEVCRFVIQNCSSEKVSVARRVSSGASA